MLFQDVWLFFTDTNCCKQPSFKDLRFNLDLFFLLLGFATMVYLSDESYNLVAVKIWTDLRHFAIEDIVVRCSFISASNLQWQSEFRSAIPVLLAGDLSVFSACPKEKYLQEKVNELKSMIEVNREIFSLMIHSSYCCVTFFIRKSVSTIESLKQVMHIILNLRGFSERWSRA